MPEIRRQGARIFFEVSGSGPTVLLLHGFTGSGSALSDLVEALSPGFTCVAMDLLGHGGSDSPRDPERYRLQELAQDALAVADSLGPGQFGLFGYSLGGRVAMRLALLHPGRIARIAIESASPGIEDAKERAARRRADEWLADEIEKRGTVWFTDHWQSIPLFRSQERLPQPVREAQRRRRLRQSPEGLAMSLRGAGTGRDPDVWGRVADLPRPLLLLAGGEDEKYTAIARRMSDLHPAAELHIVPGVGHTVHLEEPRATSEILRAFFEDSKVPRTQEGV